MRNDHNYTVYALAAFALFFCMALISSQLVGCAGAEPEPEFSLEEAEERAEADTSEGGSGPDSLREPVADETSYIYVYICGAVARPGVYELKEGSRIYELLSSCGGFLPEADSLFLNQAQPLSDGEKVYVPLLGEDAAGHLSEGQAAFKAEDDLVNINTAGVADLTSISGIGQSRAADIIAYREANGAFGRIEDIMNVPGIKEGLFAKIREKIKV